MGVRVDARQGARQRTAKRFGVGVVAFAQAVRQRHAGKPPVPSAVHTEYRRGHLAIERQRPVGAPKVRRRGLAPRRPLPDGRTLDMGRNDPALRHLDHAWASTVHAFQGRTVDNVIAAMEASHPHLTTQKSFYVEISRARDRAETDAEQGSFLTNESCSKASSG